MEKILIVDDEKEIRQLIKDFLAAENFESDFAVNGSEAVSKVLSTLNENNKVKNFNLILLDIMMPELNGIEAAKEIRKISSVPIIFLTSKSEDMDKIIGLEIGADDYITKPFNPMELIARIRAVIRRSKISENAQKKESAMLNMQTQKEENKNPGKIIIKTKEALGNKAKTVLEKRKKGSTVEIDENAFKVFLDSNEIKLTNKEFKLLAYLAKNKNILISREKLLEQVWEFEFAGFSRTVDVHVKELRKKIGDSGGIFIETIWGAGYRLNSENN